ncbi:hypothetical protein HI914_00733 [Erysiphe necator]|nr:hypothetical protein HI914_00733 [Erysiphe necator]
MSTGSISLSSKDFSASCLPNTVVISGTKMSRAKRQKRQRLSSKKRRARKRDIEFWHRAIERPDTKPVDRLVAHLSHIEHRSWKEVQEIVVQRTGIFNKIPAMQMKMTRLKEKAEAEFASSSSVLSVSIGEEFPLKEAQWPFENGTIQEANSDGYVWQPNLLENRTSASDIQLLLSYFLLKRLTVFNSGTGVQLISHFARSFSLPGLVSPTLCTSRI